jgi:hypothetical protein
MSIPEELKKELLEEFEKHLEEVRSCPMTPGSLEPLLTRAAHRMARLTQETLARTASEEADFPPSGVSALRRGASVQPADKSKDGGDGVGQNRV